MLKGANRYVLSSSEERRSIQLRANAPTGISSGSSGLSGSQPANLTGTTGHQKTAGNNKANLERYSRDLLDGFVDYNTSSQIRPIQNDIYFSDPICGSIIDIRSKLPFSNFELSGCESKERRNKYTQSINAMQIRSMFPRISRERMVEGKHVSFMNFDDGDKRFSSIIPYNPEYLTVTPIPVYGRDPLIDVNYPAHIINAVKSNDEDMKAELENYAEDLITMINEKRTRLDPKFTLYVANQPFSWSPYGISILRRVIPLWLIEKALMRGTIDMSGRRQKALRQIVAGDQDWLPTNDQLAQLTQLFIDADNDPLGAIVATRPGVEINEVGGVDFWRVDESWDAFTTVKFRALGVSESIFGDLSVQAAEQTINSTLEDLNSEREEITYRVLYHKMFPIIAVENDFKLKNADKELTSSDIKKMTAFDRYKYDNDKVSKHSEFIMLGAGEEPVDPSELDLPQVRWEKSLKIVSNDTLFNNLGTLAERGMPAPLRMQAAVLGVSAEDLFAALPQDIEDRKMIDEYSKKLPQSPAQGGGEDDGGGGDNSMFMESSDSLSNNWRSLIGSNPTARTKNRDFSNIERRDTQTGKVLSRKGRAYKEDRDNKVIMEATERLRSSGRFSRDSHKRDRSYSYRKGN